MLRGQSSRSVLPTSPDGGKGETANSALVTMWRGPASLPARRGWRKIWAFIKGGIIPAETQRFLPTVPGYVLIILAVGLCAAAYNTTSNILFLTLSILLACFIVSGILSWLNFRGVRWRLVGDPPYRAMQEGWLRVELENCKKYFPVRGIWFNVKVEGVDHSGRVRLPDPLSPGKKEILEWSFRPESRGKLVVKLSGMISQYPYGFLRKSLGAPLELSLMVWPERIRYGLKEASYSLLQRPGEISRRPGQGDDLIQIRKYEHGDSFHRVHWKATARTGTLMVRKMSGEDREGVFFWVDTSMSLWISEAQFENLLRFVGTLAEDLFARSQLRGFAINEEARHLVRRHTDLEQFLDRLAQLEPHTKSIRQDMLLDRTTLTFTPYGQTGVSARLGGVEFASL